MWTRSELKTRGKEAFKRSYWGLVILTIILAVLNGGFSGFSNGFSGGYNAGASASGDMQGAANAGSLFSGFTNGSVDPAVAAGIFAALAGVLAVAAIGGILLSIFLISPLTIGAYRYIVEASYEAKTAGDLKLLGFPFKKGKYGNTVKIMFLYGLYIFLWTLLFVIPGIIKTYEYRMIPYILAENPEIDSKRAFQLSKEMMTGNKWAAFVLDLSFIGWHILGIFTCGILEIFYVAPYETMTDAMLYDTLKKNASFDYFDHSLDANGAAAYASADTSTYEVYEDNNTSL